ncbi:hypothetical protein [Peijinzhouia sedimentorum]
MKTKLISIALIFFVISCNALQEDTKVDSEKDEEITINPDSIVVEESLEAIWKYDFNEQTEEFEVKQLRSIESDAMSGEILEEIINKSWPRVQIEFTRTSNDTVFISIPDSEALTQQMGSAGAESFMISTTFSFTELKGIKYVSFDFTEGDHARPGVYSRESWKGIKVK